MEQIVTAFYQEMFDLWLITFSSKDGRWALAVGIQ